MVDLIKKRNKYGAKKGLPPGTVVHVGEERSHEVSIDLYEYDSDKVSYHEDISIEDVKKKIESGKKRWLNINGIHDVEQLQQISDVFGLNKMVTEDIANTEQRPKAERQDDTVFVTTKMRSSTKDHVLEEEQISFVLLESTLISYQENPGDVFQPVRNRLESDKYMLRQYTVDYLLFALLDVIIDNYYSIIDFLNEKIYRMEESVYNNPKKEELNQIQADKRQILVLKRAVYPLRESVYWLKTREHEMIRPENQPYFRDLHDHVVYLIDMIDSLYELNTGLRDTYMGSVNLKTNSIIQTLTIVSTIFIPLTFLAGIYGMNFRHIPELEYRNGYFVLWGIMILIAIILILIFKRKRWL